MVKLSVEQALAKAKSHIKKGEAAEAETLFATILKTFPNNKKAQQGLTALDRGQRSFNQQVPPQMIIDQIMDLYNQGQLEAAFQQAHNLTTHYPRAVTLWNILGASAAQLGKFDQAVGAFKEIISLNPDQASSYYNLGNALKDQGKLEEAIEAYNKALVLRPDYELAYNNILVALDSQGQSGKKRKKSVIEKYHELLKIKAKKADEQFEMALELQTQGKFDEAVGVYKTVISLWPNFAEAYSNMGIILKIQGKLEDALEAYNKAIAIKPDFVEAYNNMGITLREQGKLEEAIEAFENALAIKPDYSEAWLNGAETFEKWNKLNELGLWLEKASKILRPVPSDLCFFKAKLLWRNKDAQQALKLIFNIDVETITEIRQQDYLNLKAKCYEALKDYDLAFNCFENMNLLAIKSNDYLRLDPENYFKNLKDQLEILNSNSFKKPAYNVTEQTNFVPIFLVGFPRSGTTLLDTILRSHSCIDVVEEQPLVSSAKAFVEKSGYTELGQALSQKVIAGARKAYINELDKHRNPDGNKSILIDKLPLNLFQIPLIQQLYPQAKFILALRHPLDTILSCWMQNFELNLAMANMVRLDRIVEFYCVAMETFMVCRAKYNLSVHQIKYEDLLEDLSGEASALLNFLDLDWEDHMKNYQETALNRGRINTPSYSQVVQPIYKDAKYRWVNYEKHLRQYIKQVEPWINEFGYSNT